MPTPARDTKREAMESKRHPLPLSFINTNSLNYTKNDTLLRILMMKKKKCTKSLELCR